MGITAGMQSVALLSLLNFNEVWLLYDAMLTSGV